MRTALEARIVAYHELSTPDLSVSSVACTVESYADYFALEVVLGHAACNMGMMVLDADLLESFELQRQFRAEVAGVQIVRDYSRRDAEEPLHMLQGFPEENQSFQILQIADVLAQNRVVVFSKAERVLQLASAGQNLANRRA